MDFDIEDNNYYNKLPMKIKSDEDKWKHFYLLP